MYDQLTSSTSNIPMDPSRQPDGSSILCLSCHDGTIAIGSTNNVLPPGSILGTDLSDDHPISFVYNSTLVAADGQLHHSPMFPAVLDVNNTASNEFSDLCYKCHDRNYWNFSTHSNSMASWNGSGKNPWAHNETYYSSVGHNGCANCHVMHSAGGKSRLMKRHKASHAASIRC